MAVLKNLFSYKEKLTGREKYLLYILFLKRNDLVIKLFHFLGLTVLDINLYLVSTIVLFVQLFDACDVFHPKTTCLISFYGI